MKPTADLATEGNGAVVIACAVFRDVIGRYVRGQDASVVFMDYGLHLMPKKMRGAIQAQIDALETPRLILIGFGLCGNGLVGLQARRHTLVIPRVDDCISLFLGSRAEYLGEFHGEPATYYLTPGWLECGGEPLSEFEEYRRRYGPDKAAMISNLVYARYRRACFVALTAEEMCRYRPRALMVAKFCRKRWGWQYRERIGSDALLRRLLAFSRGGGVPATAAVAEEFVIVCPGGEVSQAPFMADCVKTEEESNPCSLCTTR